MNLTLSDWNTRLRDSFDRLHPSVISSFTNTYEHDILVIIGLITVCLLLFLLIVQCFMKVRQIYRTSEPKERYKKSSKTQLKYSSYQKLLDTDNNQCKCFQYSCLTKFQCIKPTCQILNHSSYYEQIDERPIYRIYTPRNISCVRVHNVK
jgi:hypothetical protein